MRVRRAIELHKIRAQDLLEGDVIRGEDGALAEWRYVYDVALNEDQADTENARAVWRDLDERYVVLRIGNDPKMVAGPAPDDDGDEHPWGAWRASGDGHATAIRGRPDQYDDRLLVLYAFDLVDVQIVREIEESG